MKYISFFIVAFFFSIVFCHNNISHSQPLNTDINVEDQILILDSYEINLSIHEEKSRHKFKIDSLCLDLYDYSILKGWLEKSDERCQSQLDTIESIHKQNLKLTIEEYDKSITDLEKKIHDKNKELIEQKLFFEDKLILKNDEIFNYKVLFYSTSIISFGLILSIVFN